MGDNTVLRRKDESIDGYARLRVLPQAGLDFGESRIYTPEDLRDYLRAQLSVKEGDFSLPNVDLQNGPHVVIYVRSDLLGEAQIALGDLVLCRGVKPENRMDYLLKPDFWERPKKNLDPDPVN